MNRSLVRIVGALGALLNAAGVYAYLEYVGVVGTAAPASEPSMPPVITSAFAIAVFGGIIGSVGLLLLQPWARPMLWISFVASVVNWGWVLTQSAEASVPLGVTVIVVSLLLALTSERLHRSRG